MTILRRRANRRAEQRGTGTGGSAPQLRAAALGIGSSSAPSSINLIKFSSGLLQMCSCK